MEERNRTNRSGVLPVESRRAGRGPGSPLRRSPQKRAGSSSILAWTARGKDQKVNYTGQNSEENNKLLVILQWNAEGVHKKKEALKIFLHENKVDVACIQETHLNNNLRFSIRGYTCIRQDRENRPKGGILILIKNDIPTTDIVIPNSTASEIMGTKLILAEGNLNIFNCYCPPDKDLELDRISLPNSEESWLTTSTPDLAFATNGISKKCKREVADQLATSDHRPILIQIETSNRPIEAYPRPRWNYKKANWELFSSLTDSYTRPINCKTKQVNKSYTAFSKAVLWQEKTEHLNVDRDGHKLWSIAKRLNQEENRATPIVIDIENTIKTEKDAAKEFITHFSKVGQINISHHRVEEVKNQTEVKEKLQKVSPPSSTGMIARISKKELGEAMKLLKLKQAPGPDKISNDMLMHLGPNAKKKLLQIFNEIEDGFQEKKPTSIVWVDFEKAFDKVWEQGLILKLINHQVSHNMLNWIKGYLSNRKASVSMQGKRSHTRSAKENNKNIRDLVMQCQ
ncbi:uncharacterized protein LOC131930817 [Physella acuta]|uniref:uncharacterized protein LOC131930817 n=1 Tax=Physella acuta TaxID=109671 RepID=UPI0027DAB608|nr:uncharacterized protein LOC131930817 [Physella acuta]